MYSLCDKIKIYWFALSIPSSMPNYTLEEREYARKTRLASVGILCSILLALPLIVRNCYPASPETLVDVCFEAVNIISFLLNKYGYMKYAIYNYILGYIAVIAGGLYFIPASINTFFLWQWIPIALPAVVAGLYLPFWSPFIFAALESSLTTAIFLIKQQEHPFLAAAPTQDFLIYMYIVTFAMAVISALYAFSLDKAIKQADRATELEQAHTKLADAYSKLEELATIDPITGLLNHRAFNDRLNQALEEAKNTGGSVGLIFADLDHFKKVNDTWGHQIGDAVLAYMASCIRKTIREGDSAGRYGGEEFVILVPGTTIPQAYRLAERLRATIADLPALTTQGQEIFITASLGVACFPLHGQDMNDLIQAADNAMYAAKRSGRDRVCTASTPVIAESQA